MIFAKLLDEAEENDSSAVNGEHDAEVASAWCGPASRRTSEILWVFFFAVMHHLSVWVSRRVNNSHSAKVSLRDSPVHKLPSPFFHLHVQSFWGWRSSGTMKPFPITVSNPSQITYTLIAKLICISGGTWVLFCRDTVKIQQTWAIPCIELEFIFHEAKMRGWRKGWGKKMSSSQGNRWPSGFLQGC